MAIPDEVLRYINALKWPAFAGAVVFALRGSIKKFLDNFRMDEGSAKIPGVGEITWKKNMQEVSEKVDALPETEDEPDIAQGAHQAFEQRTPTEHEQRRASPEPDPKVQELIEPQMAEASSWDLIERLVISDPTGAVMAAWERLGEEVYGVAYRHKAVVSDRERRNTLLVAQRLGFPSDALEAIKSLRDLRNRAAHFDIRITSEDAVAYVQAVRKLLVEVQRW